MKLGHAIALVVLVAINMYHDESHKNALERAGCSFQCLKTDQTAFDEAVQCISELDAQLLDRLPCRGPPCEFKDNTDHPIFLYVGDLFSSLPLPAAVFSVFRMSLAVYLLVHLFLDMRSSSR